MKTRTEVTKYLIKIKDEPRLLKVLADNYNNYVKANPWELSREGQEIAKAYKLVIGDFLLHNTIILTKEK